MLLYFVSPTLGLATWFKRRCDRTRTIWRLNGMYLTVVLVAAILLGLAEINWSIRDTAPLWIVCTTGYFLWSRAFEVMYAFLRDALDKLRDPPLKTSELTYRDRVQLALRSYLELLVGFGLLYWLLPATWWKGSVKPSSILEAIYFSGVTVTTLGYGDLSPAHFVPQFLTVFQVLCGFSLLIVSFAVYASRGTANAVGRIDSQH